MYLFLILLVSFYHNNLLLAENPAKLPPVEKIVKIRSLKGEVFFVNSFGNKSKLKESTQLGLRDEVVTEYQAEVILYYGKELEIKLFGDSRLKVEQMYDKIEDNDLDQMKRFGLIYGKLFAFIAKTSEVDGPLIRFNAPLISVKPQGRYLYLATTVEMDKIGKQEVNMVAGLEEGVIARFDKNHQTAIANYGQGVRATLEGLGKATRDPWVQQLNWAELGSGMENLADLQLALAAVRPIRTTNWKMMAEDLSDYFDIYSRKAQDFALKEWQKFDYPQKEKWAAEKLLRFKQFINPE